MRSGLARVLDGSHSFTCTPRVHLLTEWTIAAVAFPAEAGTHLPTPEGWKAELCWAKLCVRPSAQNWQTTYQKLMNTCHFEP